MKKPIIGIVGKTDFYDIPEELWSNLNINDEFRYLVVKNDGIPISILPTDNAMEFNTDDSFDKKELTETELNDLLRVVHMCDGIILQGGMAACKYEIEVAKEAIKRDIPLLGICAGFNNIIRAHGSDVIKDLTNAHNHYDKNFRHNVNVVKDSLVYELSKKDSMQVNSIHSMIATKEMVKPFAKVSSTSDDGLVESFEVPNKKFVVGIKWHPELMLEEEFTNNLFAKFIEKCK